MCEGNWVNNKQEGTFEIKGNGKKTVVATWKDGFLVETKEKPE